MQKARLLDIFFHTLFIIALGYFCLDLRLDETIVSPPQSIHQWRQTDGASMARVFQQENNSLFQPKILNQFNSDGSAGGEFPITYFIAGKLYQIFGFSYMTLRLIHFIPFVVCLLISLQILFRNFKFRATAVVTLFIMMCSATFMNYAVSPLTDVCAFGFSLLASVLLIDQRRKSSRGKLWLSTVLFALAGLLKISMLLPLFAIVGAFSIQSLVDKNFKVLLKQWLPLVFFSLLPVLVWYVYIAKYNAAHESIYFTTTIRPFWSLSSERFSEILVFIITSWRPIIFSNWIIFILAISSITLLISVKKWKTFEGTFLILLLLGSITYFLLFYVSLEEHDYYYIPFFFLIIAIVGFALKYAEEFMTKNWISALSLLIVFIITWQTAHAAVVKTRETYKGWFNDLDLSENLHDIESFLEDHNIPKTSKFVVPQDESSNISLFFLNRAGYTKLSGVYNEEDLDPLIDKGVDYALVLDTSFYSVTFLQYHITDTIGYHHELGIYKVGHSKWWNPEAEGLSE